MGDGPGQSLVAEQRNPRRNGLIKWADATIMHGYYLTMLAIEHKILESNERFLPAANESGVATSSVVGSEGCTGKRIQFFGSNN